MYYTGFADEAGRSIDTQIDATRKLGWKHIESRYIDNINIHNISDRKFKTVATKLNEAGIQINCFGSEVANWGHDPFKEEDFELSIAALERALSRMKVLGCKMIRGMSFVIQREREAFCPEVEAQVFPKVEYLVKMCEDAGVIYLHENCRNYGGMSYQHTLKLLDKIKSPAFKLVFDTGNPIFSDSFIGSKPYKKQDSWEFYKNVKEFIHYVHIKDGIFDEDSDPNHPRAVYCWPGEGDGYVKEIVSDLIKSGYDGGFSMEPHLAIKNLDADEQTIAEQKMQNYIKYGQRFMKLVEDIK